MHVQKHAGLVQAPVKAVHIGDRGPVLGHGLHGIVFGQSRLKGALAQPLRNKPGILGGLTQKERINSGNWH